MAYGFGCWLGLACSIIIFMVIQTNGLFDYFSGRKVTLNPKLLEWSQAALECEENNGTLLTLTDVATMYDIAIAGRWIVWVGLRMNGTNGTWHSGLPLSWTNWDLSTNLGAEHQHCLTLETTLPFWWNAQNCSTRLPSLCETTTGDVCEFRAQSRSSLVGLSTSRATDIDLEACRNACIATAQFNCQSFQHNSKRRLCELSNTNRWMHQGRFTLNDPEWNYHHMNCYTTDMNQSLIPNGWESSTMPTTEVVTEKFCFTAQDLIPTENETKEIETAIQELQDLGTVYKDRRRSMTKESATDDRPSATYVGTIAMVIVTGLLGMIVALDVLTLTGQCCHDRRKKKKGKTLQNERLAKGRSVLAQRRFFLSSDLPSTSYSDTTINTNTYNSTSANYTSSTSNHSSPIEIDDVRIQIRRPVLLNATTHTSDHQHLDDTSTLHTNCVKVIQEPVCLNTEIEIRDTFDSAMSTRERNATAYSSSSERNTTTDSSSSESRDEYSCINLAYVNTSPVLSPFYRSNSEKTTGRPKNYHAEHRTRGKSYPTFSSSDFTLWPYNNGNRYYRRNTHYGRPVKGVGKFILAYGSSDFHRDDEVESFKC